MRALLPFTLMRKKNHLIISFASRDYDDLFYLKFMPARSGRKDDFYAANDFKKSVNYYYRTNRAHSGGTYY